MSFSLCNWAASHRHKTTSHLFDYLISIRFIRGIRDHPNIVRIEEVYESTNEIYILQELCLGGELFDRLDEQPDYHYTEPQCARLVKQMLSAVRYLHSKGIIHRGEFHRYNRGGRRHGCLSTNPHRLDVM